MKLKKRLEKINIILLVLLANILGLISLVLGIGFALKFSFFNIFIGIILVIVGIIFMEVRPKILSK